MIFRQIEEIKQGKKTQTRRIQRPEDFPRPWDANGVSGKFQDVVARGRVRYSINTSYAICPKRGAAAIPDGRIMLLEIRCEYLQDISEQDAIAEGVASVDEYRQLWDSINGKTKGARWIDNPPVFVLTFKYNPSGV